MSELTVNEITSVDGRPVDFPDGITINGTNLDVGAYELTQTDIDNATPTKGLVSGDLLSGLGGGAPDLETLDKRYELKEVSEGKWSVPVKGYESYIGDYTVVGELKSSTGIIVAGYDAMIPDNTYFEIDPSFNDNNTSINFSLTNSYEGISLSVENSPEFKLGLVDGLTMKGSEGTFSDSQTNLDSWVALGNRVGVEISLGNVYVHSSLGRTHVHSGLGSLSYLGSLVMADPTVTVLLVNSPTLPNNVANGVSVLGLGNPPIIVPPAINKYTFFKGENSSIVLDSSYFAEAATPFLYLGGSDKSITLPLATDVGGHDEIIIALNMIGSSSTLTILPNTDGDSVVGGVNTFTGKRVITLRKVKGVVGPEGIDWVVSCSKNLEPETTVWSGSAETVTIPELSSGHYFAYVEHSGIKTKDEFHIPDTVAQGDLFVKDLMTLRTSSGSVFLSIDQNNITQGSVVFGFDLAGVNLVKITKVEA